MTQPDKLDEIAKKLESEMGWDWEVDIEKFTDALRSAYAEGERAGLERAAVICETRMPRATAGCVQAIRAAKETKE